MSTGIAATLDFSPGALRADDRPLVMGILNVTPDSFSDGGQHDALDAAIAHARSMREEGADLLDVGGESTRPGAAAVREETQLERVLPVLGALRAELGAEVPLSIDTRSAAVAQAAIEAGASCVNDVSAGRDPAMLPLAARTGAAVVLMHMQGTPETMQEAPSYGDVVAEVREFLVERARAAERAGVARDRIAIDPGIGFGKTRRHNLELLGGLGAFADTGYAVMLGTSRKRFMGAICDETWFTELVGATCATTAIGVLAGVRMFRVHDVKANRQAADVTWAAREASAD